MITNKCNLACSYCVLENAPHQLKRELDLENKKALVSHLYENLNFRSLTFSGGEVLLIGKHPPSEFIELLKHAKQYKSNNEKDNLRLEVYTNATYFNDDVAEAMSGVVDTVAITIDSIDDKVLRDIGRKHRGGQKYLDHTIKVINKISACGIKVKLHSVVSTKNISFLADEVRLILNAITVHEGVVDVWKFYQYMSYDVPSIDQVHSVCPEEYAIFCKKVQSSMQNSQVKLQFKDNQEMNDSLFNILSYGNAQYMCKGDSWSTSRRTQDLRTYSSMQDLFDKTDIDSKRFCQFHGMKI